MSGGNCVWYWRRKRSHQHGYWECVVHGSKTGMVGLDTGHAAEKAPEVCMKAGEHGPDEVYDKFTVVKSKNVVWDAIGSEEENGCFYKSDELTNKDEFIFVLRPETNDQAAIAALRTYAQVCNETYPKLAAAIGHRLDTIEQDYPEGNPALRGDGYEEDVAKAKTEGYDWK